MNQSQTKRLLWQRRFEAQRASGLSITAWCQQEGITSSTYYYWRQHSEIKKDVTAFIALPALVTETQERSQATTLAIHTPGGYRIDLYTTAHVALLPTILAALV